MTKNEKIGIGIAAILALVYVLGKRVQTTAAAVSTSVGSSTIVPGPYDTAGQTGSVITDPWQQPGWLAPSPTGGNTYSSAPPVSSTQNSGTSATTVTTVTAAPVSSSPPTIQNAPGLPYYNPGAPTYSGGFIYTPPAIPGAPVVYYT